LERIEHERKRHTSAKPATPRARRVLPCPARAT
jgi:hypothetical protein